jgi:hypothetical protein
MSRLHDFQIEAELPEGINHEVVGKALTDYDSEFTPGWWAEGRLLTSGANISIGGGRRPDDVIDEIAKALWSAAGRFVEIRVSYCDLEDLPYETELRDANDFERLVIAEPSPPTDAPKKRTRRRQS